MSQRPFWPVLGCLAILLTGSTTPAAEYRIQSESGVLVIITVEADTDVVIRQNGKLVSIIDTKTNKEFKLDGGEYEIDLKRNPEDIKLTADRVTLRRGEIVVATITFNGKAPKAQPRAKPDLLHSIEWQDAEQGFSAHVFQSGISPDGKLFFGAGDSGPTAGIRVYEIASGKLVHDLRPGENVWYSTAAFVPKSKYLAACYRDDKDLYLWNLDTGKVVRKLTGHTESGISFTVSPDGKRILSWSGDNALRIWEVETGKQLRTLEGHTEKAAGLFSPDGKKILTFSTDRTMRVWDSETGKELQKLKGHEEACTGSFSPDGKHVLSFSTDQTIRLWNPETGKEIRRFEGGYAKEGSRGFIAGGAQVAAFCEDSRYRIWDTASGKLVREIDLTELGGDRWTMTPSPDGKLGLVNHEDDSVRVFDLTAGKEIHRYENCRKARFFSFSPDGNFAVSGSFRAGMFVFTLPAPKGAKP